VVLAADIDADVMAILQRNLVVGAPRTDDVAKLFPGAPGSAPTEAEVKLAEGLGAVDYLTGGPPCQGHSDLNNHTRRADPKNILYLTMARAAEVLRPKYVVIENVAPVQWDKSGVVAKTSAALTAAGYEVGATVIDSSELGVPQRRRRYILVASRIAEVSPQKVLADVNRGRCQHAVRTVRWAIQDLLDVDAEGTFDTPSTKSDANARRMAYLFEHGTYDLPDSERPDCHRDGGHSYRSVYGRLRWDRPAQTVTTGFGSMGQGRYVHPQRRRTITPHEAARLQTFPDWFDFGAQTRRGVLAKAIGNAVPPLLMAEIARRVFAAEDAVSAVVPARRSA
jgi:DNA (cytosine-5)-methyltransferase 1